MFFLLTREVNEIFVQFHSLSSYRNDRFPKIDASYVDAYNRRELFQLYTRA